MGENEGSMPNGLLPEAGPVMQPVDAERWIKAEERTSELIDCIQPNQLSEERRNAVADYVQRLITKCFPCQVCTFGSVPLKTYLPDGDIDLTAFSHDQNLKETWASQVRDMLESEEKNEKAEFHVKEVQYIQAEVKIIKCLVENIVVDISFNQVGGLCTLCFLDEVDNLINQNHLFKRSVILIKAWCYYESRILGAHHGLISTYALETLVLYIFHVFNNSFHGPLEVLYRFLEFFSNFDWDNFCVSLWGPVPIKSLPDATAEPPRKDSGDLLLNKLFLDACSSVYAVFPAGQESNGQPFVSKHFNVIDPLRVSNNLGRSVSKGNFFRIRSAFAFGAKKLARLLICPKENLVFEVNQFFMNTWKRHGSGHRPDAPGLDSWRLRLSTPNSPRELDPTENDNISQKIVTENPSALSFEHDRTPPEINALPHTQSLKNQLKMVELNDEVPRDTKAEVLINDTQGRYLFARTRSSPELTETFADVSSQALRLKAESAESQTINARLDSLSRSSVEDSLSSRHVSSKQNTDADATSEELLTSSGPHLMSQEAQDMVNMMASASLQGQYHIPFNLNHGHLPFSIPPSFLASMRYPQRNFRPANIPLMDPSFSNIQFPHGLVPPNFTQYFPNIGPNAPPPEDAVGHSNKTIDVYENDGFDTEIGNIDVQRIEDKPTIQKYIPPFRVRGKQGPVRENIDRVSVQDTRSGEVYSEERSTSSRLPSGTHNNNSLRSRTSSESSWDGSVKTSKSMKEKRGKKVTPPDLVTGQVKGKIMSDRVSNQAEEDDQEWDASTEIVESGPRHHITGFEVAQTSGSEESTIPFPPMLIGPGSRQRAGDNSGMVAFYPTGPPIPFLTMLPFYNTSGASSTHFGNNETLNNSELEQNFPPERFDQLEDLSSVSSSRGPSNVETGEERKPDILNSDFESHWQNLQVGRLCQNPRYPGPLIYPSSSPVMVPPGYLQGGSPFGRPLASNPNIFSQIMTSHGNQMVPVAPVQSVASRPPNGFQRFVDEMPRHRSGTGTYLPNPVSIRERHTSTRRGNYNHDRNDNYGDRDGNHWNGNSKSRGASRSNSRVQTEKPNSRSDRLASNERSDRPWNSFRQDPVPSYQLQNGPSHATSSQNGPHSVAYGTYQGGASNGPVPPVMMCYPFEHSTPSYSPHDEQLEYGSVGPGGFPGMNEPSQLNEGTRPMAYEDHRLHGNSAHRSSPDSPSSPRHQRDYFQRNRR